MEFYRKKDEERERYPIYILIVKEQREVDKIYNVRYTAYGTINFI